MNFSGWWRLFDVRNFEFSFVCSLQKINGKNKSFDFKGAPQLHTSDELFFKGHFVADSNCTMSLLVFSVSRILLYATDGSVSYPACWFPRFACHVQGVCSSSLLRTCKVLGMCGPTGRWWVRVSLAFLPWYRTQRTAIVLVLIWVREAVKETNTFDSCTGGTVSGTS